jgi:hypothetical protein
MATNPAVGRGIPNERDEDLGYSSEDAPESQGATADTGYGRDEQGALGDEDYDPSYGASPEGEPELERIEHGADTPSDVDWKETEGDGASAVANEERDVATGDLSALEEVPKRTSWSGEEGEAVRSDDSIREEIADILAQVNGAEVSVLVAGGDVLLTGTAERAGLREAIDGIAQSVEGVKSIDNRIFVQA